MDKFVIKGGRPLHGKVQISGAKNSALPCMAAALLTSETVILHNLPYVRDIITMRRLLEDLGSRVLMPELRTLKIAADKIEALFTPDEIGAAVARRRKKLLEELKDLDRLVPSAKCEMLISGDRKVVGDAAEVGDWEALGDPAAREMGGNSATREAQRSAQFRRSLQALRDAADILRK